MKITGEGGAEPHKKTNVTEALIIRLIINHTQVKTTLCLRQCWQKMHLNLRAAKQPL